MSERQRADDVAAIRAARALIKPNPTSDDEAEYRGKGYGVRDGFVAALRLADELADALRFHEDRRINPTSRGGPALARYDAAQSDGDVCA